MGEDESTRGLIEDIITCMGSDKDRSGQPGISRERGKAFFEKAQAYRAWWQQAEEDVTILPFGENILAAAEIYCLLKPKVDDYFIRCGLASFDSKAEASLIRPPPPTKQWPPKEAETSFSGLFTRMTSLTRSSAGVVFCDSLKERG